MNPFVFSKAKHVRRETPPQYQDYTSYKPVLRREFERKCVYCRRPDTLDAGHQFGVDHYKPKHKFPDLTTSYANLFYCCNPCNVRKGKYWPKPAMETRQFVPNPCDHVMFEHLRYAQGKVKGRTEAGRFAQELLDLNDEKAVGFREALIEAIKLFEHRIREMKAVRTQLKEQLKKGLITQAVFDEDLQELDQELCSLSKHLACLSGEENSQSARR